MATEPNGAPEEISAIEAVVGHTDGDVLPSDEVVVYDYDKDGQFVGWHKEAGSGE